MRIAALCFVLSFICRGISAQHLPVTLYSSQEGAPVIGANSIYQDKQGWLWFTDGYHLIRYDGYRFKNYFPQKKYRLEFCFQVLEVEKEIWLLSYPYPFKVQGDSLVSLDSSRKMPQLVQALQVNDKQFILADNGLHYFENGSLKEFLVDSAFNFADIGTSLVPFNDTLLLAFNARQQLVIFNTKGRSYSTTTITTKVIKRDHKGRIFFTGENDVINILKKLIPANNSWTAEIEPYFTIPWKSVHATAFEFDHSDNLWITEQFRRLVRVSPDKRMVSYTEKDGLPSLWFNQMMVDKEGLLWLALNGGICKIRQSNWERYTTREGLNFNHATFFADGERDSLLFIGTQDGINAFDRGRLIPIKKNDSVFWAYALQQINGKIIYSNDSSLYQAHLDEKDFTIYDEKKLAQYKGPAIEMVRDKHGSVFMSVPHGIAAWDGRGSYYLPTDPAIFRDLMIDSKGDLWAGSFGGGLFRFAVEYNNERVSLRQLNYLEKIPGPDLPLQAVRAMGEDKNGNIIAGTRYNGLFFIKMKNGLVDSVLHYDEKDGLKNNTIWGIGVSKNDEVWIGTAMGLNLGKWENGQFRITDVSKINQIYSSANIFVDRHNTVWVANHPGVSRLINHVSSSTAPFSVFIIDKAPAKESFNYRQNNFILEFSSNTFLDEKGVTYSYRLVRNGDEAWSDPQSIHSVNYSSLKPGNYRFQVKALNVDGKWSDNIAEYAFEINPPFWQSPWFIALVVLVIAAGLYALYRYRIAELLRLQEVRNNISRNLHDDIGASLSNINILNELAKRNMQDETKAGLYLSKAGEDIQRISESLSDIVWNINPRYDDLENLFVRMKRYAADMLEGKDISAELLFPVITHPISLPMDQRRDFYLIFKEAINNLVKYSKATQALVEVQLNSHSINLLIRDNGRGFESNKAQPGNGLYNMRQRANKWKADFTVESLSGKGTVVKISMRI